MSGVEHRNQLLQDVLFEVAKYPRATLTAEVSEQWLTELPVAKVVLMSLPAKLQLHGIQQELELQLSVVKLSEQQIWVTNAKPLILNLNTFGFTNGLHKLAQLSSLESISAMTPMSFSLLLEK
ncbi:YceI family protein [Shewanella sp.]|uniref:YceI family protein n=1 Tax=Shewanella sp. TaxID=50422 RepID=UPI003A96F9DA